MTGVPVIEEQEEVGAESDFGVGSPAVAAEECPAFRGGEADTAPGATDTRGQGGRHPYCSGSGSEPKPVATDARSRPPNAGWLTAARRSRPGGQDRVARLTDDAPRSGILPPRR